MSEEIAPGIYRHYKGSDYEVIGGLPDPLWRLLPVGTTACDVY
jgi:hypothetical protein